MKRKCDECDRDHYAKGKCRVHYRMPSQLAPKQSAKPVKPIAKVSTKQAKLNRVYKVIRDQYMKMHPVCEARLPGCSYHATDLHHKQGRGEFLLDMRTYAALCRSCHQRTEMNPAMAKHIGLSRDRL